MIHSRRRLQTAATLLLLLCFGQTGLGQNFDGLIKPTNSRFLDLTDAVDPAAGQAIIELCEEISANFSGEVFVVAINSTNGRNHRSYATRLFNTWGIGSKWKDNGILVMVAVGDRRVEIILGKGEDLDKDVNHAEVIIDQFMLPNFRKGDYGAGIYEGARACAARIFGMADLKSKVDLPPLAERAPEFQPKVAAQNASTRRNNQNAPRRKVIQNRTNPWPWLWALGGITGIGLFAGGRYWLRYGSRNCNECGNKMLLLTEQQDDQFLSEPERIEEQLGSVDYDVWACVDCEYVDKLRYGTFFTRYSTCPSCGYQTKLSITQTLIVATTEHGGRVRVREDCKYCDYKHSYTYTTPRLPKPSRKSSSGGWSGGSGGGWSGGGSSGGRSSGGGWSSRPTGGSTSGRGASGNW